MNEKKPLFALQYSGNCFVLPGSVELRCYWLCLELSPSQTLQASEECWKRRQFQNIKIFDFNTKGRGLWSLLRLFGRACCACSCSGRCESGQKEIQKVCLVCMRVVHLLNSTWSRNISSTSPFPEPVTVTLATFEEKALSWKKALKILPLQYFRWSWT